MKRPLGQMIRQLLDAAKVAVSRGRRRLLPRAATAAARRFADRIVSDAILFNETACAPGREERRVDFIATKLREFGYPDPAPDGQGGISVVVRGTGGSTAGSSGAVLIFADTAFPDDAATDCMVSLGADRAVGRGLAEDSIGVAALLALAEHLAQQPPPCGRDAVLYFLPSTEGRGALERFIRGCPVPVSMAVQLRSIVLGRVEERPLGACRLRVRVRAAQQEAAGTGSVIGVLTSIASRLASVRWDREDNTVLQVARLEAGAGFGWQASEGVLEMEILSGDPAALEVARRAAEATIAAAAAESGVESLVEDAGSFPPARADVNAGLAAALRRLYARLRVRPVPASAPDHSAVVSALGIPAVSLGITTGRKALTEEWVDIAPIETGYRQVLAFLEEASAPGARAGGGA